MRKILFMVSVWLCAMSAGAQEFSVAADVVSSYVWRGFYQGGGASVQPALTLSGGRFSFGAWGSTNFSGGNKEVDFTLGYVAKNLSLSLTDYWWEGENALNYSDYGNSHHLEAGLAYTLSSTLPLRVAWNTMLLDPESQFSTYVEAAYPLSVKDVALEAALGIAPWESIYSGGFAVTNLSLKASKAIRITDRFSISVFTQLIVNPNRDDVFLVVGLSLQ